MSTRINAATVLECLEKFESGSGAGAKVTDNFNKLISFAAKAGPTAVMTTLPGISGLLATAAACALAAQEVVKFVSERRGKRDELPPYERFQVLFYTTCYRAFLDALQAELQNVEVGSERPEVSPGFQDVVKEVQRSGVAYLLGVDPTMDESPLFHALSNWLAQALFAYGVGPDDAIETKIRTVFSAQERLRVLLSQQIPEAAWMRDFLALGRREQESAVLTSLSSAADSLRDWTARTGGGVKQRHQEEWDSYRGNLTRLPDLKETMFAENFGVRKVFIAPRADYQVTGMPGYPRPADNVPALLGALLSERTPPGELRILCGGPGSGKSTVCRMLASELAADPAMHPVFLRLRHMREGADVVSFVDEHLRNEGIIDRIADLRDVPNLILILDGFDELVMASKSRLREFFNRVQEHLTTGPLRFARAIISGRDTLFPRGDGLPVGTHVLTLKPFDQDQVAVWGEKWRAVHQAGPGSDFDPRILLPEDEDGDQTPLQHLASWPLTLHLLAQVHTRGTLELSPDTEKAFLYRGIMADTAKRQTMQASGDGRFDRAGMQRFMRRLAWEMYRRETDSLDHSEVMPLLREFYPDATENAVAEFTDVAIVNAPELTKGEETGCEFVHKSFSEYLVAEHIAETVERAAFKVSGYGAVEPTWQLSDSDTTAALASVFAFRLVTPEVQEMFEPMLGRAQEFFGDGDADSVRSAPGRGAVLSRIVERLESMLGHLDQGGHLDAVTRSGPEQGWVRTAFEMYANYCAGIMITGTAAARRASSPDEPVYFRGEPVDGAFWRCVGLLTAGGLVIDGGLVPRLFGQMTLVSGRGEKFDESSFPVRIGRLQEIHGYEPKLTSIVDSAIINLADLSLLNTLSPGSRESGRIAIEAMLVELLRDLLKVDISSFVSVTYLNDSISVVLGPAGLDREKVDMFIRRREILEDSIFKDKSLNILFPPERLKILLAETLDDPAS